MSRYIECDRQTDGHRPTTVTALMTADPSLLGRAEPGSFMGIANMGIWAIITHMIIKYIFYCDARQSRQHPHCGESWHLFWFGLGRWRRAATSGLAASGIHCWLAKIVDMSNNIIVVHVSCDFVCHFFLGAIFYALYTCTGYYWMQVQAIRCLVIDAFSLQPSVFFRRPGKKTANAVDYTAVRLLVLLQI